MTAARIAAPVRYCYDDIPEAPPSRNADLFGHCALVDATTPVAGPPPAEWLALRERLTALQAAVHGTPCGAALFDAVLHGTGGTADYGPLLSAAAAEKATNLRADVVEAVHAEALAVAHDLYGRVARPRYAVIASRFDKAARRFAELAEAAGDVEATAEAALTASAKALDAYRAAPDAAAALDALVPALVAAAELAGAPTPALRESLLIALCCGTEDTHRRRVWLAWRQLAEGPPVPGGLSLAGMLNPAEVAVQTRCGRWGLLGAAGTTVRAHHAPWRLEPFDPPARRVIQNADAQGRRITPRVVDPEDQQPSRLRRLAGVLGRRTVDVLDTVPDQED
jgi:hypothetical protein